MLEEDLEENDEAKYSDDEGEQAYDPDDIPPDREVITTPYDVSVRSLLEEIKEKSLIVNPKFQRRSVWSRRRKSKLIESLLLNIPIPVLFFAEDDDGSRVVVDGQQRLRAVEEFYSGQYRLTGLEVLAPLNKKRWADLTTRQSRTILGRTLRCIVISPRSPNVLRFEMFERLNTGGVRLNDQELRNCVYRGDLNDLLEEIVTGPRWADFLRGKDPDNRLRHHELVLRYLALVESWKTYRPPIKKVLNDYLKAGRTLEPGKADELQTGFEQALTCVLNVFDEVAFRRAKRVVKGQVDWDRYFNRAVYDVQMLGFTGHTPESLAPHRTTLREAFSQLCLENENFADAVSRATADRTRMLDRLRLWADAMSAAGVTSIFLKDVPEK